MSIVASSPADSADSAALVQALSEEVAQMKRQLAWFKQQLFAWFDRQRQRPELLPSSPFCRAMAYMQNRERALRVFLDGPAVPMDNNLRSVPYDRIRSCERFEFHSRSKI